MKSIKMPQDETSVYDGSDERESAALMRRLRQAAREIHEETGETVEIYTADGIVADAVSY